MVKQNPFRMVEADPATKEEMILKFREHAEKGVSTEQSEDLWAAYQDMITAHPDNVDDIYQAFLELSSEIAKPNPNNVLDLNEYTDIYYVPERSAWFGVKDDTPEELPEMYQSFEEIFWDSKKNVWVGATDDFVPNPIPNPNSTFVYDAGRNAWFNIFTGEVD